MEAYYLLEAVDLAFLAIPAAYSFAVVDEGSEELEILGLGVVEVLRQI